MVKKQLLPNKYVSFFNMHSRLGKQDIKQFSFQIGNHKQLTFTSIFTQIDTTITI